jgi:hypothetical protein
MPYFLLLFLLAVQPALYGQYTLDAGAGTAVVNGKSFSWSIGEMCAIQTLENTDMILTQGFLQPFDGVVPTSDQIAQQETALIVPNPNFGVFSLIGPQVDYWKESGHWQISNLAGQIIASGEVSTATTYFGIPFDLSESPPGIYFLTISTAKSTQTFSISKL